MNNTSIFNEEYFKNRKAIEKRYYNDANAWLHFFGASCSFCCLGDGFGHHTKALNYYDADAVGSDLDYAITNTMYPELKEKLYTANIAQDDLLKIFNRTFNCVILYDVLEHLNNIKEVKYALQQASILSNKYILISVPVIGNPNLYADKTHHIFRTLEWWIYVVRDSGFKIVETPNYFPYRAQLIVGEKL